MKLKVAPYEEQITEWPQTGRHILAQYDDESIIVYQAYRPSIGHFAAANGYFGGEFGFSRMSWIKPNFLWMMYRCGWATKSDQEVVLAVRLKRIAFDTILEQAVHSTYISTVYETETAWKSAVSHSNVRLQWDPDHDPQGNKLERRAIQLGLRGETLKQYASDWIIEIEDISAFVREQHQNVRGHRYDKLLTPQETIYPINNEIVAKRLEISR
jgi:Domain of unknown function (DUF4291)